MAQYRKKEGRRATKRYLYEVAYTRRGERTFDGTKWVNVLVQAVSVKDGARKAGQWVRKKVRNIGRVVQVECIALMCYKYLTTRATGPQRRSKHRS